jgi:hypothetical protein
MTKSENAMKNCKISLQDAELNSLVQVRAKLLFVRPSIISVVQFFFCVGALYMLHVTRNTCLKRNGANGAKRGEISFFLHLHVLSCTDYGQV